MARARFPRAEHEGQGTEPALVAEKKGVYNDVGAKGKAKGKGTFAGQCYFCGEWGHPQSRCKYKDEYVETMRTKGGSKGTGSAWSVEVGEDDTSNKQLGAFEGNGASASWRMLGNLEEDEMWITCDSGASENRMVPQCPIVLSHGSLKGDSHVAANGTVMPNIGENRVKVYTTDGGKCELHMQVTDVRRPLMSVSKICDAGHEVIFTKSGGKIVHTATGQITKFDRMDDVYRMCVRLPGPDVYRNNSSDFSRQEM